MVLDNLEADREDRGSALAFIAVKLKKVEVMENTKLDHSNVRQDLV